MKHRTFWDTPVPTPASIQLKFGLTSGLQGSVNVHLGALLLVRHSDSA